MAEAGAVSPNRFRIRVGAGAVVIWIRSLVRPGLIHWRKPQQVCRFSKLFDRASKLWLVGFYIQRQKERLKSM